MGFFRISIVSGRPCRKPSSHPHQGLSHKLLMPLILAAFVIMPLLCAALPVHCLSATWRCKTALDITAPNKTGGLFAGGWRLESAECSEAGVYYYKFSHPKHGNLTMALNLPAVTGGDYGGGKKHLIYVEENEQAGALPPHVMELRDDISECAVRWEARIKRADAAAGGIVLGLMFISLMWISYVAKCAKSGRAGFVLNAQLFFASLLFALTAVELIFRGFNISYKDSGMMSFMADVRDQAVLHGGFRRLEKSAPDAADSAKSANSMGFRFGGHVARGAGEKARTIRIACAGDSFMFGVGVGSDYTFPAALERTLSEKAGGRRVEVLNFGVPGSSAVDVSSILLAEASASHPDLVIYGYVLNDIDLGGFLDIRTYFDGIGIKPDNLERTIRRHDLGGLREYIRTYHFFIGRYEDILLNRLIHDMYSKSYEPRRNPDGLKRLNKDFSLIHDYYSARGVPVILMIYPILADLDKGYPFAPAHERVAALGRDNEMYALDLLPFYKGNKSESLWVSRTDHHPNREGHQIAATAAANFIINNNLLKPAARHPVQNLADTDDAFTKAAAALRSNDPDTALRLIAQAIEKNPASCRLQELAANILLARSAPQAVFQKIQRMKSISAACAMKGKKIESLEPKPGGGILIQ